VNYNWDLGTYTGGYTGVKKAVLGGWQVSGIFTAQSGQPYSAFLNSDLNNDANSRNERVPGTSRNTYNLPGLVTLDPRITKSFGSVSVRVCS